MLIKKKEEITTKTLLKSICFFEYVFKIIGCLVITKNYKKCKNQVLMFSLINSNNNKNRKSEDFFSSNPILQR